VTGLMLAAAGAACVLPGAAFAADENPAPTLQWFETPWTVMERRMVDVFINGYGSVWLPPPSRAYVWPGSANQNSTSAGYDAFDRFNLGTPTAQTAFGTEQYFGAMVDEYHRAGVEVYIDTILNHNSGRQTGAGFMQDGGYPGFTMNPPTPMRDKLPTDNWGDFHGGISTGYYQSEAPQSIRYCLLQGDLVALVDIDQGSNNLFIRQPTVAGNPQNIPGGTYFNRPDPNNARFYPDAALGTDAPVNNPGMWFAGALNTGIFAAPCDVPWRNETPSSFSFGRFNTANPMAGDPVPENATGYTMRWVQWMMDVQKVDGFRLDAVKHVPSWYWDSFFDSVTHQRRMTPDGRQVNPVVFGECVEGNDFCFDRYVRKPNGRTNGRLAAGDAFANRDVLDLTGAGRLRNNVGAGGPDNLGAVLNDHIDNTDDGFNNGTVGFNHIWSHDNGTTGTGAVLAPIPTARQQGWYMHAYLLFRPGPSIVFYNGRGVNRTGPGFYPKQGVPVALGQDGSSTALEAAITNLVQLSNQFGRGEFTPRWQDGDTLVFERRTRSGATYSGNCIVGLNDRYDGGFDTRTISTSFPQGTRLIEMTGNAANATVDPNNDILDVITVGAGGSVTLRVPRNLNANGVEHNKGFVVYAPAIPSGTLSISNIASTLPADPASTPAFRRRLNAIPVVTANSFDVQLTTTKGDAGAPNNDNADDNAVFRINEGYSDFNGNGVVDIDYTNAVVPGYEQFVTQRAPLAGTTNTQGLYRQTIDATRLEEGVNYVSVVAFRKRNSIEGPLFRDFRTAVYVDRLAPTVSLTSPCPLPEGTTSFNFSVTTSDRTVTKVHLIPNPPSVADPLTLANTGNQAGRLDRWQYVAPASGLVPGVNQLLVIAFEESGRGSYQYIDCRVGPAACPADFNQDGGIDGSDIAAFFEAWEAGDTLADVNEDGGVDGSDIASFFLVWEAGGC
jgi:glycosidase